MTARIPSYCKCNDGQFYHDCDDFIYLSQSTSGDECGVGVGCQPRGMMTISIGVKSEACQDKPDFDGLENGLIQP